MKLVLDGILVGHVEGLTKEWKPKGCETEKHFEKSLYNYLERRLEGKKITKQHGVGRSKADIAVEKKVFIELKKDPRPLDNSGD
jgi:very-short-patch-repair endonuclease